jgi:uncharacterized protein YuzE
MGGQMISYSEDSDAVYIQLSDQSIKHTRVIDDLRFIDYDAEWRVVGVEFLGASAGLDLRDLPERERLETEARVLTFPIFA